MPLSTIARNAVVNALKDLLEAGTGPAKVIVRSSGGTQLAVFELSDPIGSVVNGVLTGASMPKYGLGLASDTIDNYYAVDSDDNLVKSNSVRQTFTQIGNTTEDSPVITGLANTTNFIVGEFVTVSAGFRVTTALLVKSKTVNSVTLYENAISSDIGVTLAVYADVLVDNTSIALNQNISLESFIITSPLE